MVWPKILTQESIYKLEKKHKHFRKHIYMSSVYAEILSQTVWYIMFS